MPYTLLKLAMLFLLITQGVFMLLYMYRFHTLKWKCLNSAVFVLTGVCALLIAGVSPYSVLIFVGLVASFFGDLTLDFKFLGQQNLLGIIFFFFAHLSYIAAFSTVSMSYGERLFSRQEFIMAVVIVASSIYLLEKIGLNFGKLKLPIFIYTCVLSLMVVKAIGLGIMLVSLSFIAGGILIIAGSVLFLLSDFGLSFFMFSQKREIRVFNKVLLLSRINILTYFSAQSLLAFSIIFIGV